MTADEAIRENHEIAKRNEKAFDEMPSLAGISLQRIVIPRGKDHDYAHIDENAIYLVSYFGTWALGGFSKLFNRCEFDGFNGTDISNLDFVYLTDLPPAPNRVEDWVTGNVYEPCLDSDKQMYMGPDAYGYGKAPCDNCGRMFEEHDGLERSCRPGSEW